MRIQWKSPASWREDSRNLPLLRGFEEACNDEVIVLASPVSRAPKHMPIDIQSQVDDWFEMKFGVRFRQRSIFCTGSEATARSYAGDWGDVRRLRPLANYAFCWSRKSIDLVGEFELKESIETMDAFLTRIGFVTDDIDSAISSGCEIMLVCESVEAKRVGA